MNVLPVLILASLAHGAVPDANLKPGSKAPKIEIKEWVKGSPIKSFERDKVYVVEFWATWCGPCLESIPHLTELAKKNKDVQFLGVSVWEENDKKQVQTFVASMGDKMDYKVGYGGNKTGMGTTWMQAAKQSGIPTAFIVKNDTILWIGHPMRLEKPLSQIAKGEYDLSAATKSFERAIAAREAEEKISQEIEACAKQFDSGDRTGAKTRLAKVEETPAGKAATQDVRFQWLCVEDPTAWRKVVTAQLEKTEDQGSNLAMFLVPNVKRSPQECQWLADELTRRFPDNWYPWLCGARMYRATKQYDKALFFAQKSRDVILDFQRKNPTAPKGNALDVIKALEDDIKHEKG